MTHAAESLHWYTRTGETAYTMIGANGKERAPTVRDARKLGLVPSVTSIIKCAAAPGLEMWKANQLMMAALTLPRADGESEEAWLKRVATDSRETARKAAERGTALHASLQAFYQREPWGQHQTEVIGANEAINKWLGLQHWQAERSIAHPLGFGGKCDLSCGVGVLDFKTKEFDESTDLKTWDEQAMQLAAYREGLGMGMARCAIVYVSVTTPGLCRLMEIPEEELSRGWEMFVFLLSFWKARNRYRCSFSQELQAA